MVPPLKRRATGPFFRFPFPRFLDRTLGYFQDERVGFVQVSQAYYNQSRSFTAAGAAEQTYAFYVPDRWASSVMAQVWRSEPTARSAGRALESIGGHGLGLAEDLVTSIRLHAAGWRSVYVPEIVSRGLVPEDLGSFYRQQLKWSRGVYEVAFAELPRLFGNLTWRQRLSYLTIGTYYLCGVTIPLFLIFPYLYLWAGVQPAAVRFDGFLAAAAPVAIVGGIIHVFVQRWLCQPAAERGIHWRGYALKAASWPVFFLGTLLAIAHAEVPYIPTAKQAVRGRFMRLAAPQLALLIVFAVTVARVIDDRLRFTSEASMQLSAEAVWGMVGFATLPVLVGAGGIRAAFEARRSSGSAPWDGVDVARIGEEM